MTSRAGLTEKAASTTYLSLFWGFHTNSIKMVFWVLQYVLFPPGLVVRLRAELDAAFPTRDAPCTNSIAFIDYLISPEHCPVFNACINEAFRLCASASSTRVVIEDTDINGFMLYRGAKVMAPTLHLHHSVEYWGADANIFRPERFLEPEGLKKYASFESSGYYRPYGGGTTLCPGRFFARSEIAVMVAVLLRHFDMKLEGEICPPNMVSPSFGVMDPLKGHDNLMLRIKMREAKVKE